MYTLHSRGNDNRNKKRQKADTVSHQRWKKWLSNRAGSRLLNISEPNPDAPYKLCLSGDSETRCYHCFSPATLIYILAEDWEVKLPFISVGRISDSDLSYCTACSWLRGQKFHCPCFSGCIVLHVFSSDTVLCSSDVLFLPSPNQLGNEGRSVIPFINS
jgi:hypothetical protein